MGKTIKTLYVDDDDWMYLKSLNVNISAEVRDFLSKLRDIKNADVGEINLKIEQVKSNNLLESIKKLQLQLKESQDKIETFNEIKTKEEENKLQDEKDRIERETRCPSCTHILHDGAKVEIREDVWICKSCFHSNNYKNKKLEKNAVNP